MPVITIFGADLESVNATSRSDLLTGCPDLGEALWEMVSAQCPAP